MLVAGDALAVLVGALLLDALVGDPDWLWRRWPHPVVWFGRLVAWADRTLNRDDDGPARRRRLGVATVAGLVLVSGGGGAAVEELCRALPFGEVALALAASVLLAGRSLYEHVRRVETAFATGGLSASRTAVSAIVGRDPSALDGAGVVRAAVESAAENFSDGLVAPAFWFAVAGLPGLAVYKAVNTADSMIGHRSDRHRAFGWAAARLDDALNLVPARLAGTLICVAAPTAGGSARTAFGTMRRDAGLHASPNAGWPESAVAGALGLALAGPRRYPYGPVDAPWLNVEGRRDAVPGDIGRAIRVLILASVLQGAIYAGLASIAARWLPA